jgi:MFS family permease
VQRKPLILVSLLLAAFAINLDTTIVNVALPTLVREPHASTVQLEWIVDAYNLVFAAFVLACGNLGDRVGRKGVLLAWPALRASIAMPTAMCVLPTSGGPRIRQPTLRSMKRSERSSASRLGSRSGWKATSDSSSVLWCGSPAIFSRLC